MQLLIRMDAKLLVMISSFIYVESIDAIIRKFKNPKIIFKFSLNAITIYFYNANPGENCIGSYLHIPLKNENDSYTQGIQQVILKNNSGTIEVEVLQASKFIELNNQLNEALYCNIVLFRENSKVFSIELFIISSKFIRIFPNILHSHQYKLSK